MTEKQLSRYYYLKKDIEDLETRIEELKRTGGIGGTQFQEDKIDGSHTHSSIQDKLDKLLDKLLEKRVSALEEYIKIENYVEAIDDLEIKLIIKYRFMHGMSWNQVANRLNKTSEYKTEDAIRKKIKRFLEKNEKI